MERQLLTGGTLFPAGNATSAPQHSPCLVLDPHLLMLLMPAMHIFSELEQTKRTGAGAKSAGVLKKLRLFDRATSVELSRCHPSMQCNLEIESERKSEDVAEKIFNEKKSSWGLRRGQQGESGVSLGKLPFSMFSVFFCTQSLRPLTPAGATCEFSADFDSRRFFVWN